MLFLRELKRVFKRSFGESMRKRDRGHKCELKRKITKETLRDVAFEIGIEIEFMRF